MPRLRSCSYCNRIHSTSYDCGKKPIRRKATTQEDRFRWTKVWQSKRNEIRERDKQLCQICIRLLHNTVNQYTLNDLSVHHIVSLAQDFNKRLDNDNLITLCGYHHEMAEGGEIPIRELQLIVKELVE